MSDGQSYGLFGFIFSLIFFLIIWFVWLAGWINTMGQYFITSQGLTGIEALIMGNFNIVILFALFICIMGWGYFKS